MRHTEGPWFVLDGTNSTSDRITVGSADFSIADCGAAFSRVAEANAHLIAAAPDLLAQLEALVVQIEASNVLIVPPGVRAAIKKAKGGL
jgi:hypothetical protein